jgi:hypothetical protein
MNILGFHVCMDEVNLAVAVWTGMDVRFCLHCFRMMVRV